MDLQDYLRMLRRGWPAVLVITALVGGLASAYLVLVPKSYESTTSLFVAAGDPRNITDLQQGTEFSVRAATTYAAIVDSATVLGPVAGTLRPQLDVDELAVMVSATVRTDTTLIDIGVTAPSAAQSAAIANAVAASAVRVIPTLNGTVGGRPLARLQQTRRAVEPVDVASPNARKVLALALIVGLSLGFGVTITYQSLDTRIRRVADATELTDVPLLGVLPRLPQAQRHGLVVRDQPTGMAGEAFRTLRTNLRFLESTDRRSLLFTAVSDGRDGAHVAANVAWSLAQAGRRVLVVDVDLRGSSIGDALGIEAIIGLGDVLEGRAGLTAAVRATPHPGLRAVLPGAVRTTPSDLLSAPMLADVVRRMENEYDYVVLHAPPLLATSDAAVVSAVAGGTVITVAAGRNRSPDVSSALRVLGNVRVTPLGLVLTGAKEAGDASRLLGGDLGSQASVAVSRSPRSRRARNTARPA